MPILFTAGIGATARVQAARGQGRTVGAVPRAMDRQGAAIMVAAEDSAMALVPDGATVQATAGTLAPLAARTAAIPSPTSRAS